MIFGLAPTKPHETDGTVKGLEVETFMIPTAILFIVCRKIYRLPASFSLRLTTYMYIHAENVYRQIEDTMYTNKQLQHTTTGFDLTLKYA